MKKHYRIVTSTVAASFLVFTSVAQETTNQTGALGQSARSRPTNSVPAVPPGSVEQSGNTIGQQPYPPVAAEKVQGLNTNGAIVASQAGNAGTNAVADVDNSARNVRDRNNQTLTPGDQGNSTGDLATTRQIRKEITSTKEMSVSARNVKIITANGRVTLRGPVKTEQEKRRIGEVAARIAQSTNVDNELEVKFTPTGRN